MSICAVFNFAEKKWELRSPMPFIRLWENLWLNLQKSFTLGCWQLPIHFYKDHKSGVVQSIVFYIIIKMPDMDCSVDTPLSKASYYRYRRISLMINWNLLGSVFHPFWLCENGDTLCRFILDISIECSVVKEFGYRCIKCISIF